MSQYRIAANPLERVARLPALYRLALLFVLAAIVIAPLDGAMSQVARSELVGSDLTRVIKLAEIFAHGAGVVLILLTVAVLDVSSRRRLPRLVAMLAGAGLIANVVKCSVARWRPNTVKAADVGLSLRDWMPLTESGLNWDHHSQSFPSGHSAIAVALAVGLSQLYPRGQYLFAFFALLAMTERITSGAHYPSDTLAGGALACVAAQLLLGSGALARWFDRYEQRTAEPATPTSAERQAA